MAVNLHEHHKNTMRCDKPSVTNLVGEALHQSRK